MDVCTKCKIHTQLHQCSFLRILSLGEERVTNRTSAWKLSCHQHCLFVDRVSLRSWRFCFGLPRLRTRARVTIIKPPTTQTRSCRFTRMGDTSVHGMFRLVDWVLVIVGDILTVYSSITLINALTIKNLQGLRRSQT